MLQTDWQTNTEIEHEWQDQKKRLVGVDMIKDVHKTVLGNGLDHDIHGLWYTS